MFFRKSNFDYLNKGVDEFCPGGHGEGFLYHLLIVENLRRENHGIISGLCESIRKQYLVES
jgi:hypothetical protein